MATTKLAIFVLVICIALPSGCLPVVMTAQVAGSKRIDWIAFVCVAVAFAFVWWRFLATLRNVKRLPPGATLFGVAANAWPAMMWTGFVVGVVLGVMMVVELGHR